MTTPLDPAERELRELTSAVKRLRVAAMSDPSKGDDLADALVGLTGRRLLAWSFTDAATEAPESVLLSERILASRGAGGPYAVLPDEMCIRDRHRPDRRPSADWASRGPGSAAWSGRDRARSLSQQR